MEELKTFRNSIYSPRTKFYHKMHTTITEEDRKIIDEVLSRNSKKLDRSEYKRKIRFNFKGLED